VGLLEGLYRAGDEGVMAVMRPVAAKVVEESALHVFDNFDRKWTPEVLRVGSEVLDLEWSAVLNNHPYS
jgi:hypothetical protein